MAMGFIILYGYLQKLFKAKTIIRSLPHNRMGISQPFCGIEMTDDLETWIMAIIELNNQNFTQQTESNSILVDFYADWCGPCKALAKVLEQLSDDGVLIGKVNIDHQPELARQWQVRSVPSLIWFTGGEVKARSVGVKTKKAIAEMISQ